MVDLTYGTKILMEFNFMVKGRTIKLKPAYFSFK